MASFKLPADENNIKIAEFLEVAGKAVKTVKDDNHILIKFKYGLTITRLEIGSIIEGFTDVDWRTLTQRIKDTLKGAKVKEASDLVIRLRSQRTQHLHIRLDPLERETLEEAAVIEGKSLSDFIRGAALKRASEIFERETARKMAERQQKEETKERQTYIG